MLTDQERSIARKLLICLSGCGRKRSDPDLDLSSDLDQEAEQIGEHMITGLSPMELMQTRKFGMSSLKPEGGQLGFFPGYLKRK